MRRLIKLQYVGTAYHGWQVQDNGITVQKCVQDALEKVTGIRPNLTGCSRTDSGVHAREFCAHFDSDFIIPNNKLPLALNAHLPDDISVFEVLDVPDDFHARYSSKGKTYCYQILDSRYRNPFLQGFCWQVTCVVDVDMLNRCAKVFLGRHDFAGFCSAGSSVENTVRTVTECYAVRENGLIKFYITADGFLYNMVRIIVGTLIDCVRGRIAENELGDIIASLDRKRAGVTAPPQGLFLEKVHYDLNDLRREDGRG